MNNSIDDDNEIARALQELEWSDTPPPSYPLASNKNDRNVVASSVAAADTHAKDFDLASGMQRLWNKRGTADKEAEKSAMKTSVPGRAFTFVEQVLQICRKIEARHDGSFLGRQPFPVQPVATDDMVFLAERALCLQERFIAEGKPAEIDLGFHYTRSENLASIRTHGLLSRPDREAKKITGIFNGATHGDGVYTGNDPFTFNRFGDTGIIVARVLGAQSYNAGLLVQQDTVVVGSGEKEILVLQDSSQCIALVYFSAAAMSLSPQASNPGRILLDEYVSKLQDLVDELVSDVRLLNVIHEKPPSIDPPPAVGFPSFPLKFGSQAGFPSTQQPATFGVQAAFTSKAKAASFGSQMAFPSAQRVLLPSIIGTVTYQAPSTLGKINPVLCLSLAEPKTGDDCAICLSPLSSDVCSMINACGHSYHDSCIIDSLTRSPRCPLCSQCIGPPRGTMPSGTMTGTLITDCCEGFFGSKTFMIEYSIPAAQQQLYHPNPGIQHGSASRKAYVPYTYDGHQLICRLKYAFMAGMTFTVGRSLASGKDNSVTWASIHHKTSTKGGVLSHGFPDYEFFSNCNEELDALGVPPADKCW